MIEPINADDLFAMEAETLAAFEPMRLRIKKAAKGLRTGISQMAITIVDLQARVDNAEAKVAEHDAYRTRRNCLKRDGTPKIKYDCKYDAVAALSSMPYAKRQEAYLCHTCGKWHAGKPTFDEIADENDRLREENRDLKSGKTIRNLQAEITALRARLHAAERETESA